MTEPERPNVCCRDEANMGPVEQAGPDFSFRRCKVCQCRHFEMLVDVGKIGARMT